LPTPFAAEKQHGEFSCPKLEDVAHDIVVKERQRLTRKKGRDGYFAKSG